MIKLVAVDLDDTLVNSKLEISAKDQESIARVRAQGVILTLCTGRMHVAAMPFARQLKLPEDQVIISYNGAMLKRVNGELVKHVAVERQTALDVISYCKERNLTLNLYYNDQLYVSEINDHVQYYTSVIKVDAHPVGDLARFVIEEDIELSKMLIVADEEQIATELPRVQQRFDQRAQVTRSKARYIEITNLAASKGQALARLAESLGIEASEVMAIGDSGNDLSMVEYAGVGVAMGNASDAVKAAADFISNSNDESGVAFALDKFI